MAVDDSVLTQSLQESVLTAISFNNEQGHIIAGLVTPDLFDSTYSDIASRLIDYHKRFGVAPGSDHIDDVFDYVLSDPKNTRADAYRRLLLGMYEQSRNLNAVYVLSRVSEFVRRQTLKTAVLKAASRYQQGGDGLVEDVETILFDAIKSKTVSLSPGTFLNDKANSLNFLNKADEFFHTGIKELDSKGIAPTRKQLFVLIAPKGGGKSWSLTHLCKQALLQRARVLHITLEMDTDLCLQRYYQSMFAVAKRNEKFQQAYFDKNELGQLINIRHEMLTPEFYLGDPEIRQTLGKMIDEWGIKFGNLLVKEFPTKSLTVSKLESYLDMLESIHRFTPDVVAVDYPDLMWTDPKNHRISIGRTFEDLRGIAVSRNLAMITPTQSNRTGAGAEKVIGTHVSEDFSKMMTADIVITRSQTEEEKALGTCRLFVEKARNDEDKFTVLLTQSYTTGQFVIDSARMTDTYWARVRAQTGKELSADPDDTA